MGFDEDRFPVDVFRKLICSICNGVVENPVQCSNNGEHLYCRQCLAEWYAKDAKCPQCMSPANVTNGEVVLDLVSKAFLGLINQLDIKCRFADNNCQVTCKLESIVEHEKNCEFNYSPQIREKLDSLKQELSAATILNRSYESEIKSLKKRESEEYENLQKHVFDLEEKLRGYEGLEQKLEQKELEEAKAASAEEKIRADLQGQLVTAWRQTQNNEAEIKELKAKLKNESDNVQRQNRELRKLNLERSESLAKDDIIKERGETIRRLEIKLESQKQFLKVSEETMKARLKTEHFEARRSNEDLRTSLRSDDNWIKLSSVVSSVPSSSLSRPSVFNSNRLGPVECPVDHPETKKYKKLKTRKTL